MKHKKLCGGRRKGVAEDASPFRVGSLGKAELVCSRFLRKEHPLSAGVTWGQSEGRWDGEDGGPGTRKGRASSI